jgi:YVTN family beta-propeller protein
MRVSPKKIIANDLKKKPLLVLLILVITISIANTAQAIKVVATIPFSCGAIVYDSGKGELLGTTPSEAYVNEIGMKVYNSTNSISAISDRTNTIVANVTVGDSPISLAYDSGKGETFVANQGSGTVSVILDSTHTVVATIDLKGHPSYSSRPSALAYDSGKSEIFASDPYSGTISVISDSSNKVVSTIPVGSSRGLEGLIYDSVKNEIFVIIGNANGGPNYIKVISDSSNSVIATLPLKNFPDSFGAYDWDKGEIFVANPFDNTLSVISDSTNVVVATIPVGNIPTSVAYYGGNEIFVTNSGDNTVSVISDSNNTLLATVPVGEKPLSTAYDYGMNEIFVTNSDSISVLSDSNVSASPTPPVPEFSNLHLLLIVATLSIVLSAVYLGGKKIIKSAV